MSETAVKERPITFTDWSVQRILAGAKTQTRRVIKPQPFYDENAKMWCYPSDGRRNGWTSHLSPAEANYGSPFGRPGERIWVREAWECSLWADFAGVTYRADPETCPSAGRVPRLFTDLAAMAVAISADPKAGWRSPMFMPRWASRLLLEVVSVRADRLQHISEADCVAEGISHDALRDLKKPQYRRIWDDINAKNGFGWETNPWVWVVEFKVIERGK